MKRICVCLALVIMMLVGCGTPYSEENPTYEKELENGYFVEISNFSGMEDGLEMHYKIAYAKDTKVKYLLVRGYYKYAITPLYNADGSLQIYEE